MKNHPSKERIWNRTTTIILALVVPLLAVTLMPKWAGTQVLPNAKLTCPASSSSISFNSWFSGGTPALNAAVTPADSVNFSNSPNEDFYRWSYRMFLWLTSPTPATYGGTGRVFSSPEFYNVSPPDPVTFMRTLSRNQSNPFIHLSGVQAAEALRAKPPEPMSLGLRVANLGPHGFPFIKVKEEFIEVIPPKVSKDGRLMILNEQNKEIEVSRVQRSPAGEVQFLDTKAKPILRPQLQLHNRTKNVLGIQALKEVAVPEFKFAFKIDPSLIRGLTLKGPIFVLPSGAVIDPEVGQSDGNVQMTQSGSLIYYGIAVNDVFAYYLTGQRPGTIPGNQFPVNATDIAAVQTFATAHGHTFLNPNALAIEIKTSWVEAATLPNNGKDYITMMAKVPKYSISTNQEHWVQNGTKTIRVALLGMHVVGSTKGHPEMIWATFEHVDDTPNVSYAFVDQGGAPQTQGADPVGSGSNWLFCGATAPTPPFVPNASAGSNNKIDSNFSGTPVKGTSVMRLAPWGAPNNFQPNPLVSVAESNTQIISLNKDVRAQMNPTDVRVQYLFLGATWTEGGAGASTNFHGANGPSIVVGTSHLAGSTMETYTQSAVWVNGTFPGPGCLSCHRNNTVNVSHIYNSTKPLF